MSGIDGLSGMNHSYFEALSKSSTSSVENTASKDYNSATDEELMEACKEFETYFVEQMFQSMRATIHKEEQSSTSYMDMFEDTLYQEYAQNATESGQLGLAQVLFEQMKRTYHME